MTFFPSGLSSRPCDPAEARSAVWKLLLCYTLAGGLWLGFFDSMLSRGLFVLGSALGLYGWLMQGAARCARSPDREEQTRSLLQALETTNRAHDLLRDVLARIGDGFAVLDKDWRFTYVNAQGAVFLGHAQPQTLLGRHLWTEFPGIGDTSFQRILLQSLQDQQPAVREDFYAPWNRWFEFRIYPTPDGVSVYFSDITARHETAQALRVSELRYRLAASHGQVWDWRADTDRLSVSDEFWHGLGRTSPSPAETLPVFESCLHPDDLPRFRAALSAHLRARTPYALEFSMRHADGSWRWFQTQGQAVWDAQGRPTYMAGTTFEITERKQVEAALRESESYRRRVFEQLADGVLLVDHTLAVLDANAQAQVLFDRSRSELLSLSLPALLAAPETGQLQMALGRLLSGQRDLDEWECRRRDGALVPTEVSLRTVDGRRHVLVLRDISVRRASERALLTYQLELSELTRRLLEQEKRTTQRVAQSLHDHVGQTLAVIRLQLEGAHAAYAAAMPEGMGRACGTISRLLDQAVREVRHVLVELRPPMLESQGLVAALDNEIHLRSGTTAVDGSVAEVRIEASAACAALRWPSDVEYSVFMVAREAIANARQHAQAGLIRVVVEADATGLTLEVVDDGCGIPPALRHGRPGHLGMVGMRERAITIGARLSVDSRPEGGTCVHLRWEGTPT